MREPHIFPLLFAYTYEIFDVYHAVEHLKPLMLGLGIWEGSRGINSAYKSRCTL